MSKEDEIRAAAFSALEQAIGPRSALYIMSKLPVVDWTRLATKDDLRQLATKDDLRQLATTDDLRQLATQNDLRHRAANDTVRLAAAELRVELKDAIADQTKWFAGFVATFIAVWSGVTLGLAGWLFT